jgi:outer membrane protein assembly factor BamB
VIVRRFLAGVLVVLAALVGWRVLRPTEVLNPARNAYPAVVVDAPGVTGKTAAAPLIVQGRIRVFAAKRQVRADAPVDAKTSNTPRWSYRRWPQQLSGVVAVGSTVVTRWSDGRLVAIDGRTGTVVWRASGPPAGGYTGARTGAATVWKPPGLSTAGTSVLVSDGRVLVAVDAATGRQRWRAAVAGDCFGTAGGQVACGSAVLDAATGAPAAGWPAGPFTSLGCGVAASGCSGVRDAAGRGWLTDTGTPRRAPGLDPPDSTVAAGLALATTAGLVVARSPIDGAERWRWTAPPGRTVTVLGSAEGAVYLLTDARELCTVDAGSGRVSAAFVLAVGAERTTWRPGLWQVADGFVAVERIDDPDPSAVHHYFTVETVIIAST